MESLLTREKGIGSNYLSAIIYGVYRTFIHTGFDTVQVTSVPMEIDSTGTGKRNYFEAYKTTLKIHKKDVVKVAKKLFGVSLDKLVDSDEYNTWNALFNKGYYND